MKYVDDHFDSTFPLHFLSTPRENTSIQIGFR